MFYLKHQLHESTDSEEVTNAGAAVIGNSIFGVKRKTEFDRGRVFVILIH